MELRIFTEPQQGATYDDLLAVARQAEELGFGAFFRSDHYLTMSGLGLPGPTDAWTTLAGLARDTSRIRLGTLMTSATFRFPGPLAIQVAQVDQMSGGRVELGLGAGWFAQEHAAYGIPFPDTGERFERFEEQLEIVTGLWSAEPADGSRPYSFAGRHYALEESPALPKPVQRGGHRGGPPVIVGGRGRRRATRLAATYADEFNTPFAPFEETAAQFDRVRAACTALDRDPASIALSAALVLCVGADEAEFRRRAEAIGRNPGELRAHGLAGTPQEVVDKLGRYAELGAVRGYLQLLDLHDPDHLALVAADVVPHLS